ncbi:MAG: hypothetical protein ABSD31_01365 [Candidatus Binataceae bacterium]|jgi:hypothetical protein
MLKRNAKVVAVGLLIVTMLILPAAARAQGVPPVGGPHPGGVGMPAMGAKHPYIRKSIKMLEKTKFVLQKDAANDFGGHKAQAIQNIDAAIAQLKMALRAH